MRFSLSALVFAASLLFVNAQDLTGVPTCALACFATAVPEAGCALTDVVCQCTTGKDKITEGVTACITSKCTAEDIALLAPAVSGICERAGVTVSNLPTAAPTASGSVASLTASVTAAAAGSATGAAVANAANIGVLAMGVAAMWL